MITKITDLPAHAIGFTASGHVTKSDYDNILLPAVKELAQRTGSIYYLFVIETNLGNFSAGAWWDDIKVGLQHLTQWKKIAVVSDNTAVERLTHTFGFVIPGEVKAYKLSELQQAKAWVSEK